MESSAKKTPTVMTIDVGNSKIAVGVFAGADLRGLWRSPSVPTTADELGPQLLQCFQTHAVELPQQAIISSVVPALNPVLRQAIVQYLQAPVSILTYQSDFHLKMCYETPTTLGVDRLVNAFAAAELFGGDCLVIDAGTATTFDLVSAEREYLGGVILPGPEMMSQALSTRTAQLFQTDLVRPETVIGRSTTACIQSGLVYGLAAQVEGLTARISAEWGRQPRVIATGGNASLLADLTAVIDTVQPLLTLHGLRLMAGR